MNPNWKKIAREHLAVLRLPPEREIEIVEELALHLEAAYDEVLTEGLSETEAEARTVQTYDWRLLECELSRAEQPLAARALQPSLELIERKGGMRMESFIHDLRFGVRMLVKNPGFTWIAVLTLALGIGANTAIFSVVNTVLLRPLPYKDAEQLLAVWEVQTKSNQSLFSPAEFLDYQTQNQSFTDLAAYRFMPFTLTGQGEPKQVDGMIVSANFFSLLGVPAERGRILQMDDGRAGATRVAVISHDFWQQQFGSDPNAVGKALTLNGEPVTLIGVMRRGFQDPSQSERQIWLNPRNVVPDWSFNSPVDVLSIRETAFLRVIARLKPNVTLQQAQTDVDAIAARLQQQYPRPAGHGARVVSLHEQTVGTVRPTLLILLGAVSLVLLIACANVTSLMLSRATERYKEMAIRSALGASRWRIVRQLLLESLLLAFLGGVVGLIFGYWSLQLIVAWGVSEIPRLSEMRLDYRVFIFTLVVSVLTGLVFGLAPTLGAVKPDLTSALKEGSRGATDGRNRLRQTLVIAEVALALVVLIGAGLLLSSFSRLLAVKPGFNPQHLLTMRIGLNSQQYSKSADKKRFVRELNARLETIPGVESVGIGDDLPIAGTDSSTTLKVQDQPATSADALVSVGLHVISPHYFDALGTRLLKGRFFTERDGPDAPSVFIINETLAHRVWPNEDPLGKRIRYNNADPWGEVVGVVEDVKFDGLHLASTPHLFEPYQQNAWSFLVVTIRSPLDQNTLLAAVQREVKTLDPNLPVSSVRMMEDVVAQSLATRRFVLLLFGLFAGLALLLATVGIYGVLTASVSQRTRELGIRMALGATARDVGRLIVRQGLKLVLSGIVIGVVSALALQRVIGKLLFGISPTDPLTFTVIAFLLIGVALLACWIPARRATKVDPLTALRSE
jgi:putative ABC transport system permease protein